MSELQEIDIFVKPDGTVKVEVRGVTGKKCLSITENIEKLLGGKITERIHTDEFEQLSDNELTERRDAETEPDLTPCHVCRARRLRTRSGDRFSFSVTRESAPGSCRTGNGFV